jgi:hypothetical protein
MTRKMGTKRKTQFCSATAWKIDIRTNKVTKNGNIMMDVGELVVRIRSGRNWFRICPMAGFW